MAEAKHNEVVSITDVWRVLAKAGVDTPNMIVALTTRLAKADSAHNYGHTCVVALHVFMAAMCTALAPDKTVVVLLAALLHEVDDRKLFPDSVDYAGARAILGKCCGKLPTSVHEHVLKCIKLVSAKENGNDTPDGVEEWELLVRHADRLEAVGVVGLRRTFDYGAATRAPTHLESTLCFTHEDELKSYLQSAAGAGRFDEYRRAGASASTVDHIYDKLLHVCDIKTSNKYIRAVAEQRKAPLVQFLLEFGRIGAVSKALLQCVSDECVAREHAAAVATFVSVRGA